jgi:hypothetical protein
MNKIVILILISITVLGIFMINNDFFYQYQLSKKGTPLTENQMLNDIEHMLKKKLKVNDIEILSNGRNKNTTVINKNGEINNKAKILRITGKVKDFNSKKDSHPPINVVMAMKLWLFLNDRISPYTIDGILVTVRRGGAIDTHWPVLVTKDQFLELSKNIPIEEEGSKEVILAKKWVKINDYKGWNSPE